jgi:hypothetical protein
VSFQITIISVDWDWTPGGPCHLMMVFLYPGFPNNFSNPNSIELRKMHHEISEILWEKEAQDYYDLLDAAGKEQYDCTGDPCDPPSEWGCNAVVSYTSSLTCQAACVYTNTIDGRTLVHYHDCVTMDENCCVKKRLFCWCNGVIKKSEINIVPADARCEETQPPFQTCPNVIATFPYDEVDLIECGNYCDWEW